MLALPLATPCCRNRWPDACCTQKAKLAQRTAASIRSVQLQLRVQSQHTQQPEPVFTTRKLEPHVAETYAKFYSSSSGVMTFPAAPMALRPACCRRLQHSPARGRFHRTYRAVRCSGSGQGDSYTRRSQAASAAAAAALSRPARLHRRPAAPSEQGLGDLGVDRQAGAAGGAGHRCAHPPTPLPTMEMYELAPACPHTCLPPTARLRRREDLLEAILAGPDARAGASEQGRVVPAPGVQLHRRHRRGALPGEARGPPSGPAHAACTRKSRSHAECMPHIAPPCRAWRSTWGDTRLKP